MSLYIKPVESKRPVSLSASVGGYQVLSPARYFKKEVWIYHLFSVPQFPLGSREGVSQDQILDRLIQQQTLESQGIVNLKIRHERNILTWIASLVTLGVLTPTALVIEGEIVDLAPLNMAY